MKINPLNGKGHLSVKIGSLENFPLYYGSNRRVELKYDYTEGASRVSYRGVFIPRDEATCNNTLHH